MKKDLEMSVMGEVKFFFDLQIKQKNERIFINQSKYANNILKKFGMDPAKLSAASLSSFTKIDRDNYGICFDEKRYRCMIGSLLHL